MARTTALRNRKALLAASAEAIARDGLDTPHSGIAHESEWAPSDFGSEGPRIVAEQPRVLFVLQPVARVPRRNARAATVTCAGCC